MKRPTTILCLVLLVVSLTAISYVLLLPHQAPSILRVRVDWLPLSDFTRSDYTVSGGVLSFASSTVPDALPKSFEVGVIYIAGTRYYSRYYKDAFHVYYWDLNRPADHHFVEIASADPETFTIVFEDPSRDLTDLYASDRYNVYYQQWPIQQGSCHANPGSFRLLLDEHNLPSGYAVDAQHVFYTGQPPPAYIPRILCLDGADPSIFKVDSGPGGSENGLAHDSHHVWQDGLMLP